jgi:glycosyltransferase involved in cell wall biosynthesis
MNSKPHLLFLTNMPTPYQLDYFDALSKYFELHVCYFTDREADRYWQLSLSNQNYKVTVLNSFCYALKIQHYIPSFHHSGKLKKFIDDTEFDFLILNGTYWTPNVRIALRKASNKKAKITFWGEPLLPSGKFVKGIKEIAFSLLKKHTDFIMAIGNEAITSYRSLGYNKPIYNIPYSINGASFKKENLDIAQYNTMVKRYRDGVDCLYLSSGSLIHRKGMDTIINAFKNLSPDIKARLLIIGEGPERDNLKALAGNADVVFAGFQQKEMVPYFYAIADIFVFASRYDGWGLVINEAIEAGKPIIASRRTGAVRELLVDGESCYLCEPDDISAFCLRMNELAINLRNREKMAQMAATSAVGRSSEETAEKVYGIYKMA